MLLKRAVTNFLEGYFSTCERSEKTISAYTLDLRQFSSDLGERTRLERITSEMLETWSVRLKNLGYASASIRRKFATVRVFFNYWVRKKRLEISPVRHIRLDLGKDKTLPKVLSLGETKQLLGEARRELGLVQKRVSEGVDTSFLAYRNLAMIDLLLGTGIRVGELVAISLADLDLDEGIIVIKGKGSRQRLALLPDSRSRKLLRSYLYRRISVAGGQDLFLNVFGEPLSTQGVAYAVSRLAEKAGIEKRVTPHMLRHTAATLLLRNGADIRIVQEFLGHASILTTQRYTHVTKEHMAHTLQACHPYFGELARR